MYPILVKVGTRNMLQDLEPDGFQKAKAEREQKRSQ